MKNKIITYLIFLIIGILLGSSGYYLFSKRNNKTTHAHIEKNEQLYSCGMHPEIIEKEPGTCPICGMNLTPIKNTESKTNGKRKIIYWRAPMNPNEIYDKPGKSKMGMDLVPVYEDEETAEGVVTVDGSTLQNMNVKTEFVKNRNLTPLIYTNGMLTIDETKVFAVTSKTEGWVEKLYVNYTGQKVQKGQKLFDIYSPELIAAQQEVITALGSDTENGMLNNAIKKLELYDVSKKEIDKLIKTKKVKKILTFYSPVTGTVLSKNILKGEKLSIDKELLKIANLSSLWLKADIYENEFNKVEIGSDLEINFPSQPEKTYKGKISFIYPSVNSTTRTVTVRANINNANNKLKPNMFASVKIIGKNLRNVPTVPESAVIRSGKSNRVILSLGAGKFKPVEVTLGIYAEGYYQIISGIKTGDKIVTSGQFMIDSESSLRSAIKLFSSENSGKTNKHEKKDSLNIMGKHLHKKSIVHKGIINVESIDINKDGKVYECPMDWNVISDEDGRCPVCNMFLKEYSIEETKANLNANGFEYKKNAD